MQGTVGEPGKRPLDHAWKLGLLGLAALGFLIRKRL
jgi:MYXO-CTERM domain-containing protein